MLHLCDFMAYTAHTYRTRDLDAFDMFAGEGAIYQAVRSHGHSSYNFDVETRPWSNDILTTNGFCQAILHILRVKQGALGHMAHPVGHL